MPQNRNTFKSLRDYIFSNHNWLIEMETKLNASPIVVGPRLDEVHRMCEEIDTSKPMYMALLSGDISGDVRHTTDLFFESLRPYRQTDNNAEIFLDSGIILNIADIISNPEAIPVDAYNLLYSEGHLQTQYLFLNDTNSNLQTNNNSLSHVRSKIPGSKEWLWSACFDDQTRSLKVEVCFEDSKKGAIQQKPLSLEPITFDLTLAGVQAAHKFFQGESGDQQYLLILNELEGDLWAKGECVEQIIADLAQSSAPVQMIKFVRARGANSFILSLFSMAVEFSIPDIDRRHIDLCVENITLSELEINLNSVVRKHLGALKVYVPDDNWSWTLGIVDCMLSEASNLKQLAIESESVIFPSDLEMIERIENRGTKVDLVNPKFYSTV
jgi:hypothetical protein